MRNLHCDENFGERKSGEFFQKDSKTMVKYFTIVLHVKSFICKNFKKLKNHSYALRDKIIIQFKYYLTKLSKNSSLFTYLNIVQLYLVIHND